MTKENASWIVGLLIFADIVIPGLPVIGIVLLAAMFDRSMRDQIVAIINAYNNDKENTE